MANEVDPALASSLSAPASDVPAQQRSAVSQSQSEQQQPQQPQPPAPQEPKESKPANAQPKEKPAPAKDGAADGTEKISPAELKKRAKAEKAARRAREKLERDQSGGGGAPAPGTPAKKGQSGKDAANAPAHKGQRGLPRRGSAQAGQTGVSEQKKKEDKSVAVFGHLYGQQRRTTVAGAGKEVHPAVLALGLQMRDYVICGSSARCVATLLAFKRVGLLCDLVV